MRQEAYWLAKRLFSDNFHGNIDFQACQKILVRTLCWEDFRIPDEAVRENSYEWGRLITR